MNFFYCRTCGKSIPKFNRQDSLYCSDYCRKKAYDIRKQRYTRKQAKINAVAVVNSNSLVVFNGLTSEEGDRASDLPLLYSQKNYGDE